MIMTKLSNSTVSPIRITKYDLPTLWYIKMFNTAARFPGKI